MGCLNSKYPADAYLAPLSRTVCPDSGVSWNLRCSFLRRFMPSRPDEVLTKANGKDFENDKWSSHEVFSYRYRVSDGCLSGWSFITWIRFTVIFSLRTVCWVADDSACKVTSLALRVEQSSKCADFFITGSFEKKIASIYFLKLRLFMFRNIYRWRIQ